MAINEALERFGLSANESKTYNALLELGESSVQVLALKAGLQRPNCYAVLESLRQKGLVSLSVRNRGRRYIAENPRKLKEMAKENLKKLDELLPSLQSLFNESPRRPVMKFYEGKEAIAQLYDEILSGPSFDCIYSPNFVSGVYGGMVEEVGNRTVKEKIKTREIITDKEVPSFYPKIFKTLQQQFRHLPMKQENPTDLILYEDKVAIVSYKPNLHALVIEGSGIVQMVGLMFDQLWKIAKHG